MCVIEIKTHKHSHGRRSKKETIHYCREGRKRGSLCDHVEDRSTDSAVASEVTASSSSRPDIITTGKDGKQRQYYRISGTSTKRSSLEASHVSSRTTSNVTSVSSPASVREVRPSTSHGERPHRRSTKYSYRVVPEDERVDSVDGDDTFERPPSLELLQADGNADRSRPTSATPSTREVLPTRGPSQRKSRPSAIIVDTGASMTATASSIDRMSPGLSNLPRLNVARDSANNVAPRGPKGKYQARVDSLADDEDLDDRSLPDEDDRQAALERQRLDDSERYQQERISREINAREARQTQLDRERHQAEHLSRQAAAQNEEQARIERNRLKESDRRQSDRQADADRRRRIRMSQEAETQARARAEAVERERHRQDTAAALERTEADAEYQRRINAEYAEMERERYIADTHRLAASALPPVPQYYEHPRSLPPSPHQITYTASPISARQMTNTYLTNPPPTISSTRTISARHPTAIIHNNYTSSSSTTPRDSLSERGEAVIAQTQAAAAAAAAAQNRHRRLSSSMRRMNLRDEELDAVIETRMYGRQQPTTREWERERERVRRFERQQQYF